MKLWELWLSRKPFVSCSFGSENQIVISDANWEYAMRKYGFREFMMPEGYEKYGIMKDNSRILELAFNQFLYERKQGIDKVVDAFFITYNPIENTDRYEEITDTTSNTGQDENTKISKSKTVNSNVGNTQEAPDVITTEVDNKSVYGYNEVDTATPTEKNETTGTEKGTRVTDVASNGEITDNSEDTEIAKKGTVTTMTHSNHTHGNIGVTTNAQMLEGELEIRKRNLIDSIFYDFFQSCSYVGW